MTDEIGYEILKAFHKEIKESRRQFVAQHILDTCHDWHDKDSLPGYFDDKDYWTEKQKGGRG